SLNQPPPPAPVNTPAAAPAPAAPPPPPAPEVPLPQPAAPPPPPAPSEPASHHAFLGSTAQPKEVGIPFPSSPSQPDWAAPYDLVPMDPLAQAGASTSEFGSTPVGKAPEESGDNFSQVKSITPPADFSAAPEPMPMPVDDARSAV